MPESPAELSDRVKRQMNQAPIHDAWEAVYRTPEIEAFFELCYDDFTKRIAQPAGSLALDIGCGICANSLRLARRGYQVEAGDYSEAILPEARANVAQKGFADKISISRQDILNLTFPSDQFDLVLCWGVLMHIPDAERALGELARVAKPGGYLVFEEVNQSSPGPWLMRLLWRLLKRNRITITRRPAGSEHTSLFAGETLFWRHVSSKWLREALASHDCKLVSRTSGLFSEGYKYLPKGPLKAAAHACNRMWLKRFPNLPGLASHNIFIFQKSL